LLSQAARIAGLPAREKLEMEIDSVVRQYPGLPFLGSAEPRLESLFEIDPKKPNSGWQAFTDFMVKEENRVRALGLLRVSARPLAKELLGCRALTNLVVFSPSQSSSGQASDTALSICGLLNEEGHLSLS